MDKIRLFLYRVDELGFQCSMDKDRKFKILDGSNTLICFGLFTEKNEVLFTFIMDALIFREMCDDRMLSLITPTSTNTTDQNLKNGPIEESRSVTVSLETVVFGSGSRVRAQLTARKKKRIKIKFLSALLPRSCRQEAISDIECLISEMRKANQPRYYLWSVVVLNLISIAWHGVWFKLSGYFYSQKEQSTNN